MSNKIYPIGIQNFESLRQDGYFYIDKTALMYQMVKTGRYYFLSRPRRFGKSLLIISSFKNQQHISEASGFKIHWDGSPSLYRFPLFISY